MAMTRHATAPLADVFPQDDADSVLKESKPIQRRFNIVLLGETGVGKSSLINLILGLDYDVAETSPGASRCTVDNRPYDITIQGREFRIFDTPGLLENPSNYSTDAMKEAYGLVRFLSYTEGINLLVFCIRRGRITANMQLNYLLFYDFLCDRKVPTAIIITRLEHEENMEDWWLYSEPSFTYLGLRFVGHACTTTRRESGDKYRSSRQAVHDLLTTHGCGVGPTQERVSWVMELPQKLPDSVGFQPRLDPIKLQAQKLREYRLTEDEIKALLMKISAVDEYVLRKGGVNVPPMKTSAVDRDQEGV